MGNFVGDRAWRIRTEFTPRYEVPRTAPPTQADTDRSSAFAALAGLCLDMRELAEFSPAVVVTKLTPLVTAYSQWIDSLEKSKRQQADLLKEFGDASEVAVANCRLTLKRIQDGLELLGANPQAANAFQFMNRAMWLQRTHSLYAEAVRRGEQPILIGISMSQES